MPRPANPKTPEGKTITAAIEDRKLTQAKLAEALEVTPSFISQFASGHRPVPWDKAATLAALLGLEAAQISADFRRMQDHFGASQSVRLDAATITAAVRLASGASTGVGLSHFQIETEEDAELFALAIIEALDDHIIEASDSDVQRFARKIQSRQENGSGQIGTAGSNGGTDSSTRQAQAGDAKRTTAGRQRKRA